MSTPTTVESFTPAPLQKPAPATPPGPRSATALWLAATVALVLAYFFGRAKVIEWLLRACEWMGVTLSPTTVGLWLVAAVVVVLVWLWWQALAKDRRFHAPLLVTCVLLLGDAGFSILESHHSTTLAWLTGGAITRYSPTFVAILTATLTELVLGRFFYGKWPHPASAYVSGISAGILIKSPALWPFVLCAMISVTSKYVLRIGDRHLWNPTNLGMTLMLFLAPEHVASLSVQAGNEAYAVLVIWVLGGMILWQLKLLHITLAFLATFIPLSLLRSVWTGHQWITELAPMTSPMFQLFIFFMITDPKTITKSRWSQILVAVLVGVAETVYRLVFRDVYSLYHSLFTIGPIANLIEIAYLAHLARRRGQAPALAATR